MPDPAAVHRGQGQRLEQHVGHRVLDVDGGLGDPDQDHAAALPQQAGEVSLDMTHEQSAVVMPPEAGVDDRRGPCGLHQPRHARPARQPLDLGGEVAAADVEGDERAGDDLHPRGQLQPVRVDVGEDDPRGALRRGALGRQQPDGSGAQHEDIVASHLHTPGHGQLLHHTRA